MALGLDEDHAVAAAQAVKRKAGRILEHLDGGDIVRIDAEQRTTGSRRHFNAVDHVQRLHVGADGVVTANAYGETAIGCARDQDPRYPGRESFLDWVVTGAIELFARYNSPGERKGRRAGRRGLLRWWRDVARGAAGGKADNDGAGQNDARR